MCPAPGTVEVWIGKAAGDPSCCSQAEHRRAAGHRDPASAGVWLAGRAVVRRLLGSAAGIDPGAVVLEDDAGGKLHAPGTGLEFNVSHARDTIAVVISGPDPGPVGIDIEYPRAVHRPERLAERLFTDPSARDRWSSLDDADRTAGLLLRWTQHEALLKATGEGLRGGIAGAPERLGALGWTVRPLVVPGGGVGAVAARGSAWMITQRSRWRDGR